MVIGINARFLHSDILEGVGRYTWETIRRMIDDHPEDDFVLFFDRKYPAKYTDFVNAIGVIVPPQARHPFLFYLWFEWTLPKMLKKYNVDVFYSADNFLSISTKVPTVLVTHDLAYLHYPSHIPLIHRLYYKFFTPRFVDRADHIITVSNFVKEDIISHFTNSKNKISVAYNALPRRVPKAQNLNFSLPDNYILYVGSLNNRKNIGKLLEAFEQLVTSDPSLKLVLVGSPYALSKGTASKIRKLNDAGIVLHLVGVNDHDLPHIYRNAKVFVYISLFEGFGIPILEAMSYGVPVVTSNISSMPEVAGKAAVLVDPNNTTSIVNGIKRILEDENQAKSLISLGKKRVKHFDWQESSDHIYDQMLKLNKAKKA